MTGRLALAFGAAAAAFVTVGTDLAARYPCLACDRQMRPWVAALVAEGSVLCGGALWQALGQSNWNSKRGP